MILEVKHVLFLKCCKQIGASIARILSNNHSYNIDILPHYLQQHIQTHYLRSSTESTLEVV